MFRRSGLQIKTADEVALMRAAGRVVALALAAAEAEAAVGVTPLQIDRVAEEVIRSHSAIPSFLGYHGFPASTCISVNDEVVHGIPGDRPLADGDLVSIDCGAVLDGWHGDAAITVAVGHVDPAAQALSDATRESLLAGIAAIRVGGRLSDIGAAVEGSIGGRYGIVDGYVGHGIGTAMHMPPDVHNVGPAGRGPELVPGLVLAIEPMITLGTSATRTLPDDWTVVTADGSLAAHWEHTVAVTESGPQILTIV